MEFGSFDGGRDGEQNGVSFVEISKIFAKQNANIFGMISFGKVYLWSGRYTR